MSAAERLKLQVAELLLNKEANLDCDSKALQDFLPESFPIFLLIAKRACKLNLMNLLEDKIYLSWRLLITGTE